ncbi:restriction endonuclease subunit S [Spiroplasma endosymbiont of Aspidapion aeneum]|uniref:restriction endonuclease subunit S n=1 Tax=Spiroplasma endosymbiont of Aspidapion aeneum TaxID=3066276 RepID=UPI00313D1D6B
MAIYKLGELCFFTRGSSDIGYSEVRTKFYKYPIVSAGKSIKGYFNKKNRDMYIASISSSGANAGYITIPNEDYYAADCFSIESKNTNLLKQKYLNYYLLKNQNNIYKLSRGSAQPHVYAKDLCKLELYIPSIEKQQKIIDIIEPVEEVKNLLNKYHLKLLEFIAKLPLSGKNIKIKELLKSIKNEKKNISQISAKVINKNTGQILNLERENTYQTNSYFCEARTFLFCSIRTYLKKWAITPFDADVNGTLYQFKILQNITQLIKYFMSEKSWNKFSQMSKGTKMPVIDKDVFLDILIPKTMVNIDKIDILLVTVNKLLIKLNNLLKKMVLFFIV